MRGRHPASGIWHLASGIRHLASGIWLLASGILFGMADQVNFEADAMQYASQLYSAALRMTRNPADAEDVVQETFLRALQSLDTLRERGKFGSWLVAIARNVVNRYWSARNREVAFEERVSIAAAETPDHSELELRERNS